MDRIDLDRPARMKKRDRGTTMQTATEPNTQRESLRIPIWLGLCLFLAIATFFLWEEHQAHILGVLPYVLLLLCPLIHLFMHRGHGSHDAGHSGPGGDTSYHATGGGS